MSNLPPWSSFCLFLARTSISMKNITIIGGGACGVAAFLELFVQIASQGLIDQVSITIIEKEKPIGFGLAFGTDQPGHLLNTQADLMGLFASEPNHFAHWLKQNGGKNRDDVKGKGDEDSVYTTRKLYGEYISAHYQEYLQKSKSIGLQVEVIEGEVLDIKSTNELYTLTYSSGQHQADYVILALGTPKPCNYVSLRKHAAYIDFPYPADKILKNVKSNDRVGVLGSSLSAIDTIMTLVDNGHQGEIILFSPDGLLPRVQPVECKTIHRGILTTEALHKIQRETFKRPSIKDVFRKFMWEAEAVEGQKIDWKSQNRIGKDAASLLKDDLEIAHSGGDTLINLAYSLRHDTETIWNWLCESEKNKFKKWLGPHWAVIRHGMPIPNAERLLALFQENRLKVVPFIKDVAFEDNESQFRIEITGSEDYRVDKLINATGAAADLEVTESKLIGNLVRGEMLESYPAGGATINPQTMEVIAKKAGNGMYAVGHLVNGILIDVNAVWYNVKTIQRLSHDLILKIRNAANL
jgi:uncharacterized NAD(P)/FAD-binding protein YdhS